MVRFKFACLITLKLFLEPLFVDHLFQVQVAVEIQTQPLAQRKSSII